MRSGLHTPKSVICDTDLRVGDERESVGVEVVRMRRFVDRCTFYLGVVDFRPTLSASLTSGTAVNANEFVKGKHSMKYTFLSVIRSTALMLGLGLILTCLPTAGFGADLRFTLTFGTYGEPHNMTHHSVGPFTALVNMPVQIKVGGSVKNFTTDARGEVTFSVTRGSMFAVSAAGFVQGSIRTLAFLNLVI